MQNGKAPVTGSWQVDNIRFTTFHQDQLSDGEIRRWWIGAVGSEPEHFNINPPEKTVVALLAKKSEPIKYQLQLAVQNQQLRADWTIRPLPEIGSQSGIVSLGSLDDALPTIRPIAEKWLAEPQIKRIALGVTFVRPVDDDQQVFEIVREFVPAFDIGDAASTDFILQYNKPRQSTALKDKGNKDLIINCLIKWIVAQQHEIEVKVTSSGAPQGMSQSRIRMLCLRELDINTQADIDLASDFCAEDLVHVLHDMFCSVYAAK